MTSRSERFDKAYTKFADYTFKALYNNVSPDAIFKPLDITEDEWLTRQHEKLCTSVRDRLQAEYDFLKDDEKFRLSDRLAQLDALIAEAKTKAPLPDGHTKLVPLPEQVLRAHAIRLKMEDLRRLRVEELELKNESRLLMKEVLEKREQLETITMDTNTDIAQFQEAVATAMKIPIDDLVDSMATLDGHL